MNATVNIICYRQKTLKNGQHPLMTRVSKNGKKKYKSIGISVHPDHWDFEKNRPKAKYPNRELIFAPDFCTKLHRFSKYYLLFVRFLLQEKTQECQ